MPVAEANATDVSGGHEMKKTHSVPWLSEYVPCSLLPVAEANATDVSGGHGMKNTVSRTLVVLLAFCACCVERSSC